MLDSIDLGGVMIAAAPVGALLCLAAAAIEDGWRYRISNVLVGGVVGCFVVFALANWSWTFLGWSLAASACVFVGAAILFAAGVFGGGDTKLIAAMALWTQFAGLPRFLLVTSAAGGILGLIWIIRRRLAKGRTADASALAGSTGGPLVAGMMSPSPALAATDSDAEAAGDPAKPAPSNMAPPFARLPYGIAIVAGGIDFFLLAPASPLAGLLTF